MSKSFTMGFEAYIKIKIMKILKLLKKNRFTKIQLLKYSDE